MKKLFGKKQPKLTEDQIQAAEEQWYAEKSAFMASVLGEEHDMVLHAILPYAVGGALDLYYYPNMVEGTGIATKELVDRDGQGPSNSSYSGYELVMFTRQAIDQENAHNEDTAFGKAHQRIARILNPVARYSATATLNAGDTIEFPASMDKIGGACLFLIALSDAEVPGPKGMGIMLVIEVFRSEMEFARKNGSAKLFEKLQEAGCYPYSDLERDAVA